MVHLIEAEERGYQEHKREAEKRRHDELFWQDAAREKGEDDFYDDLAMTVADAIVYLLATSNCGMRTETIAREINLRGLHHRKDGRPVTSEQVYAVCMSNPAVFVKDGGLIRLLM